MNVTLVAYFTHKTVILISIMNVTLVAYARKIRLPGIQVVRAGSSV